MIRAFCDCCKAEFSYNSTQLKSMWVPEYINHEAYGRLLAGEKKRELCEGCYQYLLECVRDGFDKLIENPEKYKVKYEF